MQTCYQCQSQNGGELKCKNHQHANMLTMTMLTLKQV